MSSPSFTTAAISALRSNQPQHPSSANVPRHTYSSSYARDYADIQAYQEYLKQTAEQQQSARKAAKDEAAARQDYSQASTNNNPKNNYNIISHARDPRGNYSDDVSPPPTASKPYQHKRAPYAQDELEDNTDFSQNSPRSGKKRYDAHSSETYSNPSRYVSSTKASYIPPDTSNILSHLPPPPSRQGDRPPPSSRGRIEAPWALHTDEPVTKSSKRPGTATTAAGNAPSTSVPSLPLNRVPKAAFEPYAAANDNPEPTITRKREQDPRDSEEDQQQSDADWRWRQARQEAEEEFKSRYGDEQLPQNRREDDDYEQDYERRSGQQQSRAQQDYDDDYPRSQQQPQRQQQQQSRYDDEEDQVSQPMGQLRVSQQQQRRGAYDDEDDYDRPSNQQQQRQNDGDRYRRQYQDGDQDEQPRRDNNSSANNNNNKINNNATPDRPYSSRFSKPQPAYYDQPAGRASGLTQMQKDRAHQPLWGPGETPRERPRLKMVPGYDSFIEKSRQEPTKHTKAVKYDPDAAGARVQKTISRYGHLDSGFSISGGGAGQPEVSDYHGQRDGREEVARRGVGWTKNSDSSNASIYERNPILQNSKNYDPQPGSFKQSIATMKQEASGRTVNTDQWSSDTAPKYRPTTAMHPSMESRDLEQMEGRSARYGRSSDLLPAGRRDAPGHGGPIGDRGLKMIQQQSHTHSNIFGNLSNRSGAPDQTQPPASSSSKEKPLGGIRVDRDRNASHGVLASSNTLYDYKPQHNWGTEEREAEERELDARRTSHLVSPKERGYLQSSVSGGYKDNAPYSPRSQAVAYTGGNNPSTSSSANPSSTADTPAAGRDYRRQHDYDSERLAYEKELKRLHDEQRQISARGGSGTARRGQGYESTRLW